jgi:hypothetical protein
MNDNPKPDEAVFMALFIAVFSYPGLVAIITTEFSIYQSLILAVPLAIIAGAFYFPGIVIIIVEVIFVIIFAVVMFVNIVTTVVP